MTRKSFARLFVGVLVLMSAVFVFGAGNVSVSIKEWDTPSPNTHPHDTEVGPDGSLWYTGQYANVIGRLDVATGKIREYKIKTPDSGPHGLVADQQGNIWFTANNKAYIGKLNAATGDITEYPMPDPAARDPHTPLFDFKGNLWFHRTAGQFHWKTGSEDRQGHLEAVADSAFEPVRSANGLQGHAVVLRIRKQQDCPGRSRDYGDQGIHLAAGRASSALHHRGQ